MRQKSIFITGAASGIGLATALLFLKKGWFVGGYDLDEKGLSSLQDELQKNGTTACLDVTDKPAFDDAIASFSKHTDGHMLGTPWSLQQKITAGVQKSSPRFSRLHTFTRFRSMP